MNTINRNITLAIIGIIAVILLGWFFFFRNNNISNETIGGETSETAGGIFSGSLMDLTARGGDYKCTFDQTTAAGISQGTVYVSGNKMRGDFMTGAAQNGAMVENHMINDGTWIYTWSPAMAQGFKMSMNTATGASNANAQMGSSYADVNQALNYDCDAWNADASVFIPPVGMNFMQL